MKRIFDWMMPKLTGDPLENERIMHRYWAQVSQIEAGIIGFLGMPYIVLIIAYITR